MTSFWDQRYSDDQYAYGIEPNAFLKECLDKHPFSGSILFPAEGEGRNAVYAAKRGLKVVAFDPSVEGKKKAEKLAAKNQVSIEYIIVGVEELPPL